MFVARVEVLVEGFARGEHSRCWQSVVQMTSGAPSLQPAAGAPSARDIMRHRGLRACGRNTTWAKDHYLCFFYPSPPVGTILLRKLKAVALEAAGSLKVVALVAA